MRRIRRATGLTAFAIVTVALGIGVTVATYSVVYGALWRPLGLPAEDRIVLVGRTNSIARHSTVFSLNDYNDLSRERRTFSAQAAWVSIGTALAAPDSTALVEVEAVTGGYFDMLGVRAVRGRVLNERDDADGGAPVAVLAYSTWRGQFHGDPSVVGTSVKIANRNFAVVGIAPDGFRGVHSDGLIARAAWVPFAAANLIGSNWQARLTVGLRLPANGTLESGADELAAIAARLDHSSPKPPITVRGASPIPAPRSWTAMTISDDQTVGQRDAVGRLIVGLPALVLLIACTNLANLALSRGAARRHDFAVSRALGASRWQLIREQLIEQAVIACAGGGAGLVIAKALVAGATRVSREHLAPFTRGATFDWTLDARVLAAAGAAVLLCILVAGVVPALHLTRDSLRSVIDQGTASATPRWRGRANLIALQVGVSVGLFLVAVVFVRMLVDDPQLKRPAQNRVPAEFERVAVTSIPFQLAHQDEADVRADLDKVLIELSRTPGVATVAVCSAAPFGTDLNYFSTLATAPGRGTATPAFLRVVSPRSFATLGSTLASGRDFNSDDTNGSASVVIINAGFAIDVFGTQDAVGRTLELQIEDRTRRQEPRTRLATIVGVETDQEPSTRGQHPHHAYVPWTQQSVSSLMLLVQGTAGRQAPVETVRDVIRRVDPTLAVAYITRADILIKGPLAFVGDIAVTLMTLAALALGLAMAGLYGVLAHLVGRRTRELGIRVALGSTRIQIARLVLRDGFRPIVEGLFIGLATASVVRVFLRTALLAKEIAPLDPLACATAAGVVALAGALACWVPARRAAAADPNVALRHI